MVTSATRSVRCAPHSAPCTKAGTLTLCTESCGMRAFTDTQANHYLEFDDILEPGGHNESAVVAAVHRGPSVGQPEQAPPTALPRTMGPEPDEQLAVMTQTSQIPWTAKPGRGSSTPSPLLALQILVSRVDALGPHTCQARTRDRSKDHVRHILQKGSD